MGRPHLSFEECALFLDQVDPAMDTYARAVEEAEDLASEAEAIERAVNYWFEILAPLAVGKFIWELEQRSPGHPSLTTLWEIAADWGVQHD